MCMCYLLGWSLSRGRLPFGCIFELCKNAHLLIFGSALPVGCSNLLWNLAKSILSFNGWVTYQIPCKLWVHKSDDDINLLHVAFASHHGPTRWTDWVYAPNCMLHSLCSTVSWRRQLSWYRCQLLTWLYLWYSFSPLLSVFLSEFTGPSLGTGTLIPDVLYHLVIGSLSLSKMVCWCFGSILVGAIEQITVAKQRWVGMIRNSGPPLSNIPPPSCRLLCHDQSPLDMCTVTSEAPIARYIQDYTTVSLMLLSVGLDTEDIQYREPSAIGVCLPKLSISSPSLNQRLTIKSTSSDGYSASTILWRIEAAFISIPACANNVTHSHSLWSNADCSANKTSLSTPLDRRNAWIVGLKE